MPLEGMWWADDMEVFMVENRKDEWKWTFMILQPDFISQNDAEQAIRELKQKEKREKMRFEVFQEGLAGQVIHIGPYSEEGPNIEKLP